MPACGAPSKLRSSCCPLWKPNASCHRSCNSPLRVIPAPAKGGNKCPIQPAADNSSPFSITALPNDYQTRFPLALMDATWITAKRTGAATALSAKYLARRDSATVGILGCGVQGRSNLEALKVLFPLKKIYAYDTHADRGAHYAQEMSSKVGIEAVPVTDPKQ